VSDLQPVRLERARLHGLLKKSEQQIPRGLKAARDDKINGLSARL